MAQGWQWAVSNTETRGTAYVSSVATDRMGNVFSTGYSNGASITFGSHHILDTTDYQQLFIAKTDSKGNCLWAKGAHNNHSESAPVKIVTDSAGNSYLMGVYTAWGNDSSWSFDGITLANPDYDNNHHMYFMAKFDPAGNIVWAKNIALYAWSDVTSAEGDFTIDAQGQIYIAGMYAQSRLSIGSQTLISFSDSEYVYGWLYGSDIFMAKLDAAGNPLWAKNFGGRRADGLELNISVGSTGNIYLSSWYQSDSIKVGETILHSDQEPGNSHGRCFLAKFDSAGNDLWVKNLYTNAWFPAMKIDRAENVYMTGNFDHDSLMTGIDTLPGNGHNNFIVAQYDSSGNVGWTRTVMGARQLSIGATHMDIDACGSLWISGLLFNGYDSTTREINFNGYRLPLQPGMIEPTLILNYDNKGTCLQAMELPTGGASFTAVAVNNNGHCYAGGSFRDYQLALGPSTIYHTDTDSYFSGYKAKLFLAKYTYASPAVARTTSDAGICAGSYTTISAPEGYLYYEWADGAIGNDKRVTDAGSYEVLCTNVCANKAELQTIDVTDKNCDTCIAVPDAFTPNNDGVNDIFRAMIRPWCNVAVYTLNIYNRWGQQVFYTNDAASGWNGEYMSVPQEMGTYVYYIDYKNPVGNTTHRLKGSVVLIR